MKRVIAIDGPSGAGKSTIAKEVARILNFYYLDTGALYRAVAFYFYEKFKDKGKISSITDEEIERQLQYINISYEEGKVFLQRDDISKLIRDPEIGAITSKLSARKPVRDFLLPLQRAFAERYDTVAEGRDMTTVVFPDAWKKFYLDASPQIRAKRRYEQLLNLGISIDFQEALKDILERDKRDSSRKDSPLVRADDAFYIDTSLLSIDTVISIILKKVAEDD